MSFSRCDWLFPPSAREVSPGNCSNYKSTRERVDSKGLYGRWRLHLIGSWPGSIVYFTCAEFRGSPIVFSGSGISLFWRSGFGIFLIWNSGFGIERRRGRWDAKNNPRDYGNTRNFGSGLPDWRKLLGTLNLILTKKAHSTLFPGVLSYGRGLSKRGPWELGWFVTKRSSQSVSGVVMK